MQAPTYSQNFNRYSYVLNNPLKYTDPTGEFFILDSWIVGYIDGYFSKGGNVHSRSMNATREANHRANNDAKITNGLMYTDPNKSYMGQLWELISRVTWQAPQTIGGWFTTQWTNTVEGNVNWVDYKYGATIVQSKGRWGGITQGNYIMGDESIEADANNPLFQHEYGHYIQSQSMGWAYYPRIGIPSASSTGDHNFHSVEQDANRRAFLYFNQNVKDFQDDTDYSSVLAHDNLGWDFKRNPFENGVGIPAFYNFHPINYVDYQDATHVTSLDKIIVRSKWYDYFSLLPFP